MVNVMHFVPIVRFEVQIPARAEIGLKISVLPGPLTNSAMMSTLSGVNHGGQGGRDCPSKVLTGGQQC